MDGYKGTAYFFMILSAFFLVCLIGVVSFEAVDNNKAEVLWNDGINYPRDAVPVVCYYFDKKTLDIKVKYGYKTQINGGVEWYEWRNDGKEVQIDQPLFWTNDPYGAR